MISGVFQELFSRVFDKLLFWKLPRWLAHYIGTAILLVWGTTMVYFYASGRISVYLAPEFRIYSLVAGLGLCVLGLFNILTGKEPVSCGHDHGGDDGHDHDHDHGSGLSVVSLILLLVPLLVAARISPDNFSAQAIINKGAYTPNYVAKPIKDQFDLRAKQEDLEVMAVADPGAATEPIADLGAGPEPQAEPKKEEAGYGEYTLADLEAQVDKSAEGNYLLTIPQLFYTGGDEELQRVLKGLPIETTGQVMAEKVNNEGESRLRIFRLFIECCAADARPLSIPIEFGKKAPEYEEMGWIKVIGTMNYVEEEGMTVPVLEVKTMEPASPPEDEMIF